MTSLIAPFRIIYRLGVARSLLLLMLLLVSGLLEGLGIATLLPVLMVAAGGVDETSPEIARWVVSAMTNLGMPMDLLSLSIIVAVIFLLREMIGFMALTFAGFAITDIAAAYRRRLLDVFTRANWSYFHDSKLGAMSISIAHFTHNTAAAIEKSVVAISIMARTLVYVVLVVMVSGPFAFIALFGGVVIFTPLFMLLKVSQKYGEKYARVTENLSAHFSDVFASIKAIKAMGREEQLKGLFEKMIKRLNRFRRRILVAHYGLNSLQNILTLSFVLATIYLAVSYWNISILEIGFVAALMLGIVKNIGRVQQRLQAVAELEPYLWRIEKMIADADASAERTGGREAPAFTGDVSFDRVSFAYPGKPVLDRISFHIPSGKITVFHGPSGAGKTTIADLIIGLYHPQEGDIYVDDVPLREIDLKSWRTQIGYVPQELILLSGTVRANIALGGDVGPEDVDHALDLAGAAGFVAELPEGVETQLGERGVRLSGGQRQRLSLARSLVHRPRLLILDEVTSALDPETEQRICEQIAGLRGRMTVVVITHNDAWLNVADQVLHVSGDGVTGGANTEQSG